jgi:predicted alpha/beta-fold hydrolase
LGEQGEAARDLVAQAAAVSVPFDLAAGSRHLERGFGQLYTRHFLTTLLAKAIAKDAQFPGSIDLAAARAARTFWEFDDAVTAPLHGFVDAADYYAQSSSYSFLKRVQVRTLLFSALNDPIVPEAVTARVFAEFGGSATIRCDFTRTGGHVGWVEGTVFPRRYYMEQRVATFLGNYADTG